MHLLICLDEKRRGSRKEKVYRNFIDRNKIIDLRVCFYNQKIPVVKSNFFGLTACYGQTLAGHYHIANITLLGVIAITKMRKRM